MTAKTTLDNLASSLAGAIGGVVDTAASQWASGEQAIAAAFAAQVTSSAQQLYNTVQAQVTADEGEDAAAEQSISTALTHSQGTDSAWRFDSSVIAGDVVRHISLNRCAAFSTTSDHDTCDALSRSKVLHARSGARDSRRPRVQHAALTGPQSPFRGARGRQAYRSMRNSAE